MSDILIINMLGEFSIQYGDIAINEQAHRSKKVWMLLKYLLAFRSRKVTQEELIEHLWPNDEVCDPANTLKTLLHRARTMLSKLKMHEYKELILVSGGSYTWNTKIPYKIDVDCFEQLCMEGFRPFLEENSYIRILTEAFEFYKGGFLAKNAMDLWVMPIHSYYLSKYTKVVISLCETLSKQNQFEEVVRICEKSISIDVFEEQFHFYYMRSLAKVNKRNQALLHFQYVSQLFYDKFGVAPSPAIQHLYKEISKDENDVQLDLRIINEGLQEAENPSSSFYCEFDLFREIYRLMSRACTRSGEMIHICLFTVCDAHEETNPLLLENAANCLKDIIGDRLRISDIYTRYSPTQYLVILPSTRFSGATLVAKRVLDQFDNKYPRSYVQIQYQIQKIMPKGRIK